MFDSIWLDAQKELAAESAAGTFTVVPDSGHEVMDEAPEAVVDAVIDVLGHVGRALGDGERCGKATRGTTMPTYLVERYMPETPTAADSTALADLAPDITILEVIVMDADDVCFWLVEGPSAEAVSQAFAEIGLPGGSRRARERLRWTTTVANRTLVRYHATQRPVDNPPTTRPRSVDNHSPRCGRPGPERGRTAAERGTAQPPHLAFARPRQPLHLVFFPLTDAYSSA